MEIDLIKIDKDKSNKIKEELFNSLKDNPEFKKVVNEFKLTKSQTINNINFIDRYLKSKEYCLNCSGILNCPTNGYINNISLKDDQLKTSLIECPIKRANRLLKDKYYICHIKDEKFNYTLKDASKFSRHEREELLRNIAKKIKNNDFTKGIYLSGDEGVGKSFIMQVFSKVIVEKTNKKVAYVDLAYYMNNLLDFSKYDKDYFDESMDILSTIDILFLDNFGDEVKNDFSKESIIKAILDKRKLNSLPTFIISRYKINDLYNVYRTPGSGNKFVNDIIKNIKENCEEFSLEGIKYPY